MKNKIIINKDGKWQYAKKPDLESLSSYIMTERIPLSEVKEKYPDKYQALLDLVKSL